MARRRRGGGVTHHAIQRRGDQMAIFFANENRRLYLNRLADNRPHTAGPPGARLGACRPRGEAE